MTSETALFFYQDLLTADCNVSIKELVMVGGYVDLFKLAFRFRKIHQRKVFVVRDLKSYIY